MKYLFFFAFFFVLPLQAQVDIPVYTDYLSDNYYLIHPSMAGASNCAKLRATARKQWFGVDKAPSLQTLSVNGNVDREGRSGIGAIVYNDRNGNHSNKGFKATYAHHILFSRNEIDLNRLSFGVNVSLNQLQLDETGFGPEFDPIISGTLQSATYYNVDFGMSYNFLDFYAHATVKNAVFKSRKIYTDVESNNLRKYIFNAGYVFGDEEQIYYEPSIMFQLSELTKEKALDVNFKAYKTVSFGKIWAALSYRTSFDRTQYLQDKTIQTQKAQYVSPIVGANYKQFMIAYTYSHVFGNATFEKGGFHQLTLGYNFGCKRDKYDCKCPSVN